MAERPPDRPPSWLRHLAAGVVAVALRDAALPRTRDLAGWGREARAWLTADDADFRYWAARLGVDPDRLARQLRTIIDDGQVATVIAAAARPSPPPRDDDRDDEADEW